jgi:hypothetical protein
MRKLNLTRKEREAREKAQGAARSADFRKRHKKPEEPPTQEALLADYKRYFDAGYVGHLDNPKSFIYKLHLSEPLTPEIVELAKAAYIRRRGRLKKQEQRSRGINTKSKKRKRRSRVYLWGGHQLKYKPTVENLVALRLLPPSALNQFPAKSIPPEPAPPPEPIESGLPPFFSEPLLDGNKS